MWKQIYSSSVDDSDWHSASSRICHALSHFITTHGIVHSNTYMSSVCAEKMDKKINRKILFSSAVREKQQYPLWCCLHSTPVTLLTWQLLQHFVWCKTTEWSGSIWTMTQFICHPASVLTLKGLKGNWPDFEVLTLSFNPRPSAYILGEL